MVCVGIDVAKDKHDCCILDSDGMVRADCHTTRKLCNHLLECHLTHNYSIPAF